MIALLSASAEDTWSLWRKGRGSDSTLASVSVYRRPSMLPWNFSWRAQTTPWCWSEGTRSPSHRPPKAGSITLIHYTDRVTCCSQLAAVCTRWWKHAVRVMTVTGTSTIMGHVWATLCLHVLLDLGSFRQDCILSSAKEGANLTLWRVWNELLNEGWPCEEFVASWLMGSWSWFGVLDIDRLSSWLKEAESTVENVGVDKLRDQVINQFHSDQFLSIFSEEFWVRVLKDNLNLHANRQHDHWHVESHEYPLARILWFKFCLNLRDWNKQLLSMVHIKWKSIVLTEYAPVCQMGY